MKPHLLILVPTLDEKQYIKDALLSLRKELNFTYKVVCTGIGKVNAASTCALELQNSYDFIVSTGFCGATEEFSIGDVVNPKEVFDCRLKSIIESGISDSGDLVDLFQTISYSEDYILMYSSDIFVNSKSDRFYKPNSVFDMESFAITQVAQDSSIPVTVLKIVADIVSEPDTDKQYFESTGFINNFEPVVYALCNIVNQFNKTHNYGR